MTRRWLAIVLLAPLGACAVITDLGGLAGNGDGASDANAPDAPTFSCKQVNAKFCEDFDEDDAATMFAQWPGGYVANGGDVRRVASDASPPFAVRFATAPADGGPLPFAFITHDFAPLVTSSAQFAVDMRVDRYPSASSSFFTGTSVSLDGQSSVALVLSATKAAVQETVVTEGGTTYPILDLSQPVPLGKWVNVAMDFNVSSSPITLEVQFDGVTVLAPTALDPGLRAVSPSITLGETYVDPANDGIVFLNDDVVFDFK